MSEHEAIQPPVKFSRRYKDRIPCLSCGGPMAKHAQRCRQCNQKRPEVEQPADPTKRCIALTRGKITTVDAFEYDRVNQWMWFAAKSKSGKYYAVRNEYRDGEWIGAIKMHRFILGVTDPEILVDHRRPDDTLTNTHENLRIANPSQNVANRLYGSNASGYKGVTLLPAKAGRRRSDRWIGQLYFGGKRMYSSVFRAPEPAARWYDAVALKYFGEYAQLNFPKE